MSADEQPSETRLTDFAGPTAHTSRTVDADSWQPEGDRECLTCGASVSQRYARTMGDNQDRVHECPQCPVEESNAERRYNGAVAGLDVDELKLTTANTHK